jgi:hypothetical protein
MFTSQDHKRNRDAAWHNAECDKGNDGRMNMINVKP